MAVVTIPFVGFAPDIPDTTPGVLTDCIAIPCAKGMRNAPSKSYAPGGLGVLAATCTGAATLRKLDGTTRLFAGTATKLYEASGTTWTDRSAGGGSYTSSARWCFAQFGDISLATNDADNIQQSSSGAFAAVANAPKAKIVVAVPNFAVAFNTQNGSASTAFGDSPDRWWCSAYQSPTDWAINAANQCVSERLIGGGGEIVAAAAFGSGWVAYKRRDMFHAYYTGGSEVFNTQRVPGNFGCVGPEAVCDIGNAHFVVGEDDIFIYDGARPVSVAVGKVREYFLGASSKTYRHLTSVRHDVGAGLVWVFFVSSVSGTTLNKAMVYHIATGRWGLCFIGTNVAQSEAHATLMYSPASGPDIVATIGDGSGEWLSTLDGTPTSSAELGVLTTGFVGSDDQESMFHRVQLLCDSRPTVEGTRYSTRSRSGGTLSDTIDAVSSDGNSDFRVCANWIMFNFVPQGAFEVSGYALHSRPAGAGR